MKQGLIFVNHKKFIKPKMGGKNKVGLTKRIYHFLKKQIELKKYKGVETYELKLRAIEVVFSTADAYSKGWFFPRYDKGK
ncbi:MAG: hypothetical protein D4R43_02775 [Sphingobacteriales bacterium]|nr:MAG: hypothetical protein D4R43_02775 [Sphingobacteriales bacterium]